jgi:hypothetical protein
VRFISGTELGCSTAACVRLHCCRASKGGVYNVGAHVTLAVVLGAMCVCLAVVLGAMCVCALSRVCSV